MTLGDEFDAALAGSEMAQLRTIVRSLANHLACVACLIPNKGLQQSSVALAKSALEYLDDQERRL